MSKPLFLSAFSCKFSFQVRHGTALNTACGKVGIMVQACVFFEILLQNIPVIFNTFYVIFRRMIAETDYTVQRMTANLSLHTGCLG